MDTGALEPLTKLVNQFLPGKDTDAVDRLNAHITPSIMVFTAVLIAGKQWLGEPLQCYLDQHYSDFEEQYIEHYCFINGTYFVPLNASIPGNIQHREDAKLSYYQWLPIVLALQALLSGVPLAIWRGLSPKSGINLKNTIRNAHGVVSEFGDDRKGKIEGLAALINYSFGLQRHYRTNKLESRTTRCLKAVFCWVPFVGSKYGNYLPGFYLLFKIMILAVAIGQLFIFNAFLDEPTRFFALDFAHMFRQGYEWSTTGLFPRVTLCDFTLYRLANTHRYTVQCVLSINFLVEKIYIFLWFWMLFLCVITTINLIIWTERIVFDRARRSFVGSYLHAAVGYTRVAREEARLYNFVKYYLCDDGVFLLRLVSFNVGIPITAALTNELWKLFLKDVKPEPEVQEDFPKGAKKQSSSDSDNEKTSFADVDESV